MQVQVQNDNLPSGFCPASYQDLLNNFSLHQYVTLSGTGEQWTFSATTPTDTTLAWWQLDQLGRPVRQWWFAQGAWLSPHPVPAGSSARQLWVGTENDLKTFDGGVDEAGSDISGPMWEIDTDFAARFLVGPGTFANAVAVAVGGTGGEPEHTQSIAEMPEHTHDVTTRTRAGDTPDGAWEAGSGADYTVESQPTGGGDPFPVLPPFRGIYVIKRTSRVFFRI